MSSPVARMMDISFQVPEVSTAPLSQTSTFHSCARKERLRAPSQLTVQGEQAVSTTPGPG